MFGKLKEKLKGFKDSVTQKIHDKAGEDTETAVSENLLPAESAQETENGAAQTVSENDTVPSGVEPAAVPEAEDMRTPEISPEAEDARTPEISPEAEDTRAPEISPETEDTRTPEISPETKEIPARTAEINRVPDAKENAPSAEPKATESASGKKEKVGFFTKAKSLIFNQEVILDEKDLEEPLEELEMALLESDLALSVCDEIIASVREELTGTHKKIGKNTDTIVEDALRNAILKVMSANVFDFDEYLASKKGSTAHLAFIGINGTGKTTSIAKIANRLKKQGYSVVIAAGDTYRAGAIDQIQIHADRLGIKVIRHQEGSDPAAVIYDALQYAKAHNIDVLLSDTAGRMHTNVNLMAQLEKICRVSSPDLVIFVDESTAGNDAVQRAAQFADSVKIDGTILTKLDADSKGGAAISIAWITQSPILFFGIGQEYDDLMKFDPEWFVGELFDDE